MQSKRNLIVADAELLTGDGGAGEEGLVHLRVHVDPELVLLHELLVILLNLLVDPVAEDVAQDRVRHIADPILGEPVHFLLDGKVGESVWVVADEVVDLLDRQRLVPRDLQVPVLVTPEELLPPGDQVLHLHHTIRMINDGEDYLRSRW